MSLPILDHARGASLIDYFGWRAEHNMAIGLPEGEDVMQGYWDFTNDFIDFDYDKSYPSLERIVKYTRDYNKLKE